MQRERNYGIDMLRILSMLMICIHHTIVHGIWGNDIQITSQFYYNGIIIEIIYFFTVCAVNCYALISGYVGIESKWKLSNIMKLWIQVVFYCVVITTVMKLSGMQDIGIKQAVHSVSPIILGQYWYFAAYFGMYFLIPVFNAGINNLNKVQIKLLLAAIFFVFTVLPLWKKGETFSLEQGYSCLWLSLLYICGACIRKLNVSRKISKHGMGAYIILLSIVYIGSHVLRKLLGYVGCYVDILGRLNKYTSPIIFTAAICLLLYFSQVQLSSKAKRITAFLAPMTFGVYLIHDNGLIRNTLIKGSFAIYKTMPPMKMVCAILGTAIAIYLICSIIDWFRIKLFNLLKINEFCKNIEDKIRNVLLKIL